MRRADLFKRGQKNGLALKAFHMNPYFGLKRTNSLIGLCLRKRLIDIKIEVKLILRNIEIMCHKLSTFT